MDWKYANFRRERPFGRPRDEVLEAARAFVGEGLGWRIADTADGFVAKGRSFLHAAVATFHAAEVGGRTTLTIELQVERASSLGFMLFDIGGFYDGQLRLWLDGVDARLNGQLGSALLAPTKSLTSRIFYGTILVSVIVISIWLVTCLVVLPVIGLASGVLYMPGRSGDLTIRGPWARGVSAGILIVDGLIAYQIWRRRRPTRPRILFPDR
jgi:hypothetical protein